MRLGGGERSRGGDLAVSSLLYEGGDLARVGGDRARCVGGDRARLGGDLGRCA